MKAGRELDKLIAEKVMGLNVIKTEYNKGKHIVYSIGEPEYWDFAGDMQLSNPLPNYSEDLNAAMEVFQKLRDSHKWCCLEIRSDYNYVWDVWLTKGSSEEHKPSILVKAQESLPLAICLAALESVE